MNVIISVGKNTVVIDNQIKRKALSQI